MMPRLDVRRSFHAATAAPDVKGETGLTLTLLVVALVAALTMAILMGEEF